MTELRVRKVGRSVLVLTTDIKLVRPVKENGRTVDLEHGEIASAMIEYFNSSDNIDANKVSVESNSIVIRDYYYFDLDSLVDIVEVFRKNCNGQVIFLGFGLSEAPGFEMVHISTRMGAEEAISRGIVRELTSSR